MKKRLSPQIQMGVVDGELSTMENEQVIQFDFSSDKRSEVSQAESEE